MSKRDYFRQHQEEVWKQIAKILGGNFIDKHDLRNDKVIAKVEGWTITLDMGIDAGLRHEHAYLRLRAPYHNVDGFNFACYHATIFDRIGELFGAQDYKTGYPDFDKTFMLKTNNEHKAKQMFSNPILRELLLAHPEVYIHVRDDDGWFADDFPEDVDELMLRVETVPETVNDLMAYYEIFAEALNTLCHIGSAYEDDPHIDLS